MVRGRAWARSQDEGQGQSHDADEHDKEQGQVALLHSLCASVGGRMTVHHIGHVKCGREGGCQGQDRATQ